MNEVILKTYNITKKYGNQLAVDNVNMTIKKGEIYGFIGQNGAGKTTLIRLITGLIHKSAGEIELLGANGENELNKARTMIGSLIETPSFYTNMTARENLEVSRLVRDIPGKKCVDEVLDLVGLKDVEKKKVKNFSLGMRQRLGIANALMGNPKLLILDEPINGLDPMGIIEIRELLKKINKEKDMTILISSHILGELSQLATCYGFINDGKLVEEISAEKLAEKCKHCLAIKVDNAEKAAIILEEKLNCNKYEVLNNNLINVYEYLEEPFIVNKELLNGGVMVSSLDKVGSSLEDYFINLIGGEKNGKVN